MSGKNARRPAGSAKKNQTKPKPGRLQRTAPSDKAPVAQALRVRNRGPSYLKASTPSGVRIRHREFLWDVSASTEFAWDEFKINPGLHSTFPWLSAIANRFESYVFHSLRFIYEPAVATTAGGSVMMAIDYDASDIGPETKPTLMSYKDATRAAPWAQCVFHADSSDLHKAKTNYVRGGTISSTDIKLYDVGNLFVATQGQDAVFTGNVGELYVEYDVELLTPQLNDYSSSLDLVNYAATGVTSDKFFGAKASLTTAADGIESNIPFDWISAGVIELQQAGTYLLEVLATSTTSITFNGLAAGLGFVKTISSLVGPIAPATYANYVFKAARGNRLQVLGNIIGSPLDTRFRITRVAAQAA